MPKPKNPTQHYGPIVAAQNDLRVLEAVYHFGHLRRSEVASAAWPDSEPRSAYVMACRTAKRLLRNELIEQNLNSLGGHSFTLTAKGAATLRNYGHNDAQTGRELAFDGPQFYHRTLGTCYLLTKMSRGVEVFGEQALRRKSSPLPRDFALTQFGKHPDGLIVYDHNIGTDEEKMRPADWVEVESALKPYEEVARALGLFKKSPLLNPTGTLTLDKLVFLYNSQQSHEKRLLRFIQRFLDENPKLERELICSDIRMVRARVSPPLTWHGIEEFTAWELLLAQGATGPDDEADTAYD